VEIMLGELVFILTIYKFGMDLG